MSTAAGSSLSGIFAKHVARFLVSWAKQTLGPDQTSPDPALRRTPSAVEGRPERDRSRETFGAHAGSQGARASEAPAPAQALQGSDYGAHRGVQAVLSYVSEAGSQHVRSQPAGATAGEVADVAPAFARLFEHVMPADYRDFLQASNGFSLDGIVFYGIVDSHTDDGFLPGLLDSNERLIHGPESVDTPLRFVGESGHQYFAYDTSQGAWRVVDRLDWQGVDDRGFDSFAALFSHVLAPLLPKGPR